jgi:hypothetical protein
LIEVLQSEYQPDELVVGVVWGEEDIASVASDCGVRLDKPEMKRVVDRLNEKGSGDDIGWEDIKSEVYRVEAEREHV